jgi:hypothetical protein
MILVSIRANAAITERHTAMHDDILLPFHYHSKKLSAAFMAGG